MGTPRNVCSAKTATHHFSCLTEVGKAHTRLAHAKGECTPVRTVQILLQGDFHVRQQPPLAMSVDRIDANGFPPKTARASRSSSTWKSMRLHFASVETEPPGSSKIQQDS